MTRPPVVAGLVGLLVVLAGCTGAGLVPTGRATDVGPDAPTDGAGDADGTDGSTGEASSWERFSFEEGEFYRYRANDYVNDEAADVTWEVLAVDGSEATVEVTYDDGETTFSRTISGQNATIIFQLPDASADEAVADASNRAMLYLMNGPFNSMTAYYASRDLQVGNSWRLAGNAEAGYATANVEGKASYAGQECYVTAYRVPDNGEWASDATEFEACISPDAGLALYTAVIDDSTDEPNFEIVLEEYRSG